MTEKETVCIRINPRIWKDAKIFAAKHDLKLGELIEESLSAKIKFQNQ